MATLKGLVQSVVGRTDWRTAITADGMMTEILPVQEIARGGQEAAEAGLPVSSCPFPYGSERARRWCLAYHGRAMELLAEIDS